MGIIAHKVLNNTVVNSAVFDSTEKAESLGYIVHDKAGYGWIFRDGDLHPPQAATPFTRTLSDVKKDVDAIMEEKLYTKSVELGYSNFERTAIYQNSSNDKYRNETRSLADWASSMYSYAEGLQESLTLEEMVEYPLGQFKEELPEFQLNEYPL